MTASADVSEMSCDQLVQRNHGPFWHSMERCLMRARKVIAQYHVARRSLLHFVSGSPSTPCYMAPGQGKKPPCPFLDADLPHTRHYAPASEWSYLWRSWRQSPHRISCVENWSSRPVKASK